MSRLRFARPSSWRVLWSLVAAAFAVYTIVVVVVYILGLTTHDGPKPTSSNGYVGFLMWDIIFAGPIFVLMLWFVTVPAIIGLGVLAACVRRTTAPERASHQ
jgi:ABC-type sulfate transport system permease subunit